MERTNREDHHPGVGSLSWRSVFSANTFVLTSSLVTPLSEAQLPPNSFTERTSRGSESVSQLFLPSWILLRRMFSGAPRFSKPGVVSRAAGLLGSVPVKTREVVEDGLQIRQIVRSSPCFSSVSGCKQCLCAPRLLCQDGEPCPFFWQPGAANR